MLIVVAIMSLVAAGAAVAILPRWTEAQLRATEMAARTLRGGAIAWQGVHGAGCPTVTALLDERLVDRASKTDDAWGQPFEISCDGADVVVRSRGPDKRPGTPDDVVVPRDTK